MVIALPLVEDNVIGVFPLVGLFAGVVLVVVGILLLLLFVFNGNFEAVGLLLLLKEELIVGLELVVTVELL